jgi:hypothetical protein
VSIDTAQALEEQCNELEAKVSPQTPQTLLDQWHVHPGDGHPAGSQELQTISPGPTESMEPRTTTPKQATLGGTPAQQSATLERRSAELGGDNDTQSLESSWRCVNGMLPLRATSDCHNDVDAQTRAGDGVSAAELELGRGQERRRVDAGEGMLQGYAIRALVVVLGFEGLCLIVLCIVNASRCAECVLLL